MTTIYVDNRPYSVDGHQNLLAACLSQGLNLPYFCWHPAMGSVGACRQCAVKQYRDEHDRGGRLVMACMTPVTDGARISIEDRDAAAFRASIIEWLMLNHPHDCPVCDEGGECHLQDMTYMTGHAYRRYRFPKRTYRNQELGPFIKHDMNRCIQCYRCVRFYRDYAGGRDLNVFGSHDAVYFGRATDGILENEFSGNLVEVCPTGVFTDHTFLHHYTRKWDLQCAQSICPHCSVGCNTTPGERYGILRRVVNRFNSEVNGYFLCDRGRFGYGYVNDDSRIRRPLVRAAPQGGQRPEGVRHALSEAAAVLRGANGLVGIGSPRASLEANVALRMLVGADRFCLGLPEGERRLLATMLAVLRDGPVPAASVHDVEHADAVLVLGEDLLNAAPRLALAVLQSIRQEPMERADALHIPRWDDAAVRTVMQGRRGPLYIAAQRGSWLHDHATDVFSGAPDDAARLGMAAAHAVDGNAPSVPGLSRLEQEAADRIARALGRARRPVIIAGSQLGSAATIEGAANLAWALHRQGRHVRLALVPPESNSVGLALLGGQPLEWAFQAVRDGTADTVIVLENDLYRRGGAQQVDEFLDNVQHLLVVDSFETRTTRRAQVVLPAATTHESDGTVVNYEGRAQRFFQVFVPEGDVGESWRWLRELARLARPHDAQSLASWRNLDDAVSAVAAVAPALAGVRAAAPPAGLRFAGRKIPRQPERTSGRTAMLAHLTVHEPKPPEDPDTALAFSMEGFRGGALPVPSPLITQFLEPGWHSNQALNKYQEEVGGRLRNELPGVRLIEPDPSAGVRYFTGAPRPFQPKPDHWLLMQLPTIFGGDELSARSAPIRERMPSPTLVLHPSDGAALELGQPATVTLTLAETRYTLTVVFDATMPVGTAGLIAVQDAPAPLPQWVDLRRAIDQIRRAA